MGKITFVIVNQLYQTFDTYTPQVSPGGSGLRFYPSVRIEVAEEEKIKNHKMDGDAVTGLVMKLKYKKNKQTLPIIAT